MSARWLPVPGFEGKYEVSDSGLVRGVDRLDSRGRRRAGKQLSQGVTRSGHRTVSLCADGVPRAFFVHTLVLTAFVGPRPDGMECCHWNDVPGDNRLENLRWDVRSANQLDSVRNGTHYSAKQTACPKGHEYTPENTYLHPKGCRYCRECRREYQEEHREQRRAVGREYMRRKRAAARANQVEKAA